MTLKGLGRYPKHPLAGRSVDRHADPEDPAGPKNLMDTELLLG